MTAGPALAAPSWEVTMTQANPFGLQLGKDPFTESGETFAQESGYDAYTIAVKNAGDETAGAAYQSGTPSPAWEALQPASRFPTAGCAMA